MTNWPGPRRDAGVWEALRDPAGVPIRTSARHGRNCLTAVTASIRAGRVGRWNQDRHW